MPRRLRRAILLNDLALVKRIIRNNPSFLRNPDFQDKSNTSLHLAAKAGFTEVAVCPINPQCRYYYRSVPNATLGYGVQEVDIEILHRNSSLKSVMKTKVLAVTETGTHR